MSKKNKDRRPQGGLIKAENGALQGFATGGPGERRGWMEVSRVQRMPLFRVIHSN